MLLLLQSLQGSICTHFGAEERRTTQLKLTNSQQQPNGSCVAAALKPSSSQGPVTLGHTHLLSCPDTPVKHLCIC